MKFQTATTALLASSLLAITTNSPVQAWPGGAGSCPAGEAAVGGSHLGGSVTTGSLQDGEVQLLLNGSPVTDMTTLTASEMAEVELVATNAGFKGFLVRVGDALDEDAAVARQGTLDLTSVFSVTEGDADVQVESRNCADGNAAGLTHTGPDVKTSVVGMLEIPQSVMDLMMDVTVVMENQGGVSEYYHSSFMVNVERSSEATEEDMPATEEDMDMPATEEDGEDPMTEEGMDMPATEEDEGETMEEENTMEQDTNEEDTMEETGEVDAAAASAATTKVISFGFLAISGMVAAMM